MSNISVWSHRRCFVWAVNRPLVGGTRYSPEFLIGDNRLQLAFSESSGTYSLLASSIKPMCYNLTVHVEDKNRRALPLCSYHKCYQVHSACIWQYNGTDILQAMPDFTTNGLILFLITIDSQPQTFKLAVASSKDKIKVDKSVLTEAEPIQIDEKSVQTPSFMSIAPCLEILSKDLSKILEKDLRFDVMLVCGDVNVRAHRSVLSGRSSVFSAMFSNMPTKARMAPVQIRDIDSGVFGPFIRYLYTGKLPELSKETATPLYEAAHKYAVVGLQKRCVCFFLDILSPANACEMLPIADTHNDQDFKESVMAYILQHKIPLVERLWLPFLESNPKLAAAVLYRFYKLQMSE